MKKTMLFVGLIILVLNTISGLLLTPYGIFNMLLNDVIIASTTVLMAFIGNIGLKKGFVVTLPFIFAFIGLVQFVLGCFSPARATDNGCLIAILALLAFEIAMVVVVRYVSKINS